MEDIFIGPFMFGFTSALGGLVVVLGAFCALGIIVTVIGVVFDAIIFIVDKFKR